MSDSAPYQVLARKYRPQTFADLVGQEAMVRTLKNAFAADRIAQAFILTGIRVTTVMLVGIAAIGAIVLGPGYGSLIFDGLGRVGSPVGQSMVLAGIFGVIVVAIIFDAIFALLGKLTTSKGLR